MSTLDKSFIKAFFKDPGLAATPPETSPGGRAMRRTPRPSHARQAAPALADDPYLNGTWYRIDEADSAAAQAEEAAALAAAAAQQRRGRNARRPHVKFRDEAPPEATPPLTQRRVAPAQPKLPDPVVDEVLPDAEKIPAENSLDVSPDISPEALTAAFAVAYAGDWESQIVSSPAQISLWEPPIVELALAEPVVEVAVSAALPQTTLRVDPPAASAIAKPHFPLPSAEAETPVTESTAETAAEAAPQTEPAAPAKPDFQAVWEVERFAWPTNCDELLASALDDWGLAVRQLLANAKRGCKTLAVSGLRRGEGRSTLALCLARLAAQTGAQIALVDADFENPQLANLLGVGTECDWKLALADGQPLTEAAIVCLADALTFIPLQQPVPFKQVSFRQPAVTGMIKTAAASFDLVIVDVGPIAAPEHSAVWGGKSCPFDGVLLVRDLRRTDTEETAATAANLRKHGIEQVIVMENYSHTQPAAGAAAR